MSKWGQFNLQDSNSMLMEMMIFFHDHAMMILVMIMMLIFYMLGFMLINNFVNRNLMEGQMIEFSWTLLPVGFLIVLAFPSLSILYMTDEVNNPNITIKVMGHQWYWSYEIEDFVSFESFMDSGSDPDSVRLLDVDVRMIIPFDMNLRFLIGSYDVIHSFAMPSLGLKVDAVPGRLNQICSIFSRVGVFFGQCSEICGVNHSFMPIVIESVKLIHFLNWIKSFMD